MYNDLIGIPFVDGGRDPRKGLDCWGLSLEIFRRHGIKLPDYKIACEDASRIDQEVTAERPYWLKCVGGELPVPALVVIKFNSAIYCNHTGVFIGGGRFIHTRERVGVNIDRIDSPAWRRMIEGFYIPGPEVKQNE